MLMQPNIYTVQLEQEGKIPKIYLDGGRWGSFMEQMALEITSRVRSGNKVGEGNPGRGKHTYSEIESQGDMACWD